LSLQSSPQELILQHAIRIQPRATLRFMREL